MSVLSVKFCSYLSLTELTGMEKKANPESSDQQFAFRVRPSYSQQP